jgi:hypothetical protein
MVDLAKRVPLKQDVVKNFIPYLGYSSLGLSSGYNVGVCNSYASSMFSPFNQSTYLSPYSTAAFGMDMGTSHYETESYGQAALDSLASLKTDTRWGKMSPYITFLP